MAQFSRQLVDWKILHCKISEFCHFAEHCGRDKFILVLKFLYFNFTEENKIFSLKNEFSLEVGVLPRSI